MASERQIAANKKNSQKSTGPKTPEGRAAVRLNGVKHGLTAATLVLPGEKESDFESLLDSFESEHNPVTPTEEALVRQMAMAQWRLRRLYHTEAAYLTLRLDDTDEEVDEQYENLDDAGRLAYVVNRGAHMLTNLARHETRLERSFYKALQELRRLRAERPRQIANQSQSHDRTPAEPALFLVPTEPNPDNIPARPTAPPRFDSSPPDPIS